jgi:hypothetical protein
MTKLNAKADRDRVRVTLPYSTGSMTPSRARVLAEQLKRAADEAEKTGQEWRDRFCQDRRGS